MIIKRENDIELEGIDENAIEASITKKNLSKIIDLITRQQYRDPIGSIVREITSNCFDAHKEAGVNLPVTVNFDKDELGNYISFVDQGIGMSPDRIKDVYLSYGESTKELTDDLIGGFGLGGKSPLAYAESYFLTTIYNKIKYEYIVHKGQTLPIIEPLNQEETSKRNGTTIKIYFNDGKQDWSNDYFKFEQACKSQLAYFDNVIITPTFLFNNDYQIIEGNHFKLRSDIDKAVYSPFIHICIGKVAYPIDWNILDRDPIKIPIALKFEIGELIVTPERESIRYIKVNGKETKDIINEKIDLVINELQELYNKRNENIVYSFKEYNEAKEKKAILTLKETKLDVSPIIEYNPTHNLLRDFKGKISFNIHDCYTINHTIYRVGRKVIKDLRHYLSWKESYILMKEASYNPTRNQYICEVLNTKEIDVGRISFRGWRELFNLSGLKKYFKDGNLLPYNTNILKELQKLKFVLDFEIALYFKKYDDYTPTKEWLLARKKLKEVEPKQKDEIIVYDQTREVVADRRLLVTINNLEKFTGFIIYGNDEHQNLLDNFVKLFDSSPYRTKGRRLQFSKAVKILKTAYKNNKEFIKLKNAVHVTQFIGDNKVFKHFATALIIARESIPLNLKEVPTKNNLGVNTLLIEANRKTNKDINDLANFRRKYGDAIVDADFEKAIIEVAKKFNLIDEDIYKTHLRVNEYFRKLELLENINITYKSLPYVIDYLVMKDKEVEPIWTKPKEYEKELLKESIDKAVYLLSMEDEINDRNHVEKFYVDLKVQVSINNAIITYHNYAA